MSILQKDFNNFVSKESKSGGVLIENADWLKDFKVVGPDTVSFLADCTFTEEYVPISIQVPKTYPSGNYKYTFFGITKIVKADSIDEVINQAIMTCSEKRDLALNSFVSSTPKEQTPSLWGKDPNVWSTGGDDEQMRDTEIKIAKDIAKLHEGAVDGWFAQAGAFANNQCWVYLYIDPVKRFKISKLVADAWGINPDKFICLSLVFQAAYLESSVIPTISCFQSGRAGVQKLDGSELQDKVRWGLSWAVENRIKQEFFAKYWPLKTNYDASKFNNKNYLHALLSIMEDYIKNASGKCVVCGEKLSWPGIRPVACSKPLCILSYERYGLGVDIESEVKKHPEVVDLLITLAHSACNGSSSWNPFDPYPEGLQVTVVDEKSKKEKSYDFKRSGELDNEKVRICLEKFPTVQEMSKMVDRGTLKEEMMKLHPLAYSLLSWIVASNRCYLKKLSEKERVAEMNTEHQFLLLSATPEKEKLFQENKKKYGQVWAFHGSGLCNWHGILRKGLQNMSGTKGQVNGNAYGDGIYLTDDCQTSLGYLGYVDCWNKSIYHKEGGQLGILAICEVAKGHPTLKGQPNPYYVVAKEELVATRYFCLYPNGNGDANVVGSQLKNVPKIEV